MMPGLTASELIRIAVGMYPSMKVLLMTGHPGKASFASRDFGDDLQLIQKPFSPSDLVGRLEELLGGEEPQ